MQTPIAGGYEDQDLAYWLNRAADGPRTVTLGRELGRWLVRQGVHRMLCAMAGTCVAELAMRMQGVSVVCTDRSAAMLAFAHARAEAFHLGQGSSFHQVTMPWTERSLALFASMGPFDAVSCLGVSLFHLGGPKRRISAMRGFYDLLRPNGFLVIDNKRWSQDLREVRDPVSIYLVTGAQDEQPNRILAITHEYPTRGRQIYHILLFDAASRLCVGRWAVEGYPVQSTTLREEATQIGFVDVTIGAPWAPLAASEAADSRPYDFVVARKPALERCHE